MDEDEKNKFRKLEKQYKKMIKAQLDLEYNEICLNLKYKTTGLSNKKV